MVVNRIRTLGALAGLLGSAALLAGCGQQASAPSPATGNAANPAPAAAAGGSPVQTTSSASSQPATGTGGRQSTSPCTAKDFKVELTVQPDRPGILLMAVENTSKKVCKLNGWPDVVPMDASGTNFTVGVNKVAIPGGPTEFDLPPGTNGFAGVEIQLGSKAVDRVATGFTVTLPGAGAPVNANIIGTDGTSTGDNRHYAEFPVKSMKIGTLQPIAQGVTVFD